MHLNVLQVYVQIDLALKNLELFPAFVFFGISASLQSYKLNVLEKKNHDRPKLECSFGAPKTQFN